MGLPPPAMDQPAKGRLRLNPHSRTLRAFLCSSCRGLARLFPTTRVAHFDSADGSTFPISNPLRFASASFFSRARMCACERSKSGQTMVKERSKSD